MSEPQDSVIAEPEIATKKHNPSKATIFTAVLPGLGQAYNKKYWKVPIVWGGYVGLGYFVYQYDKRYAGAKKAYYDLTDNSTETRSYETTYADYSKENLISVIDTYRKRRDSFVIYTAGFYLLSILDANVDAHFIDFDISEDLTVNFEPILFESISNSPILGGQITFTF